MGRLQWLAVDGGDWEVAFSTRKGGLSLEPAAGLNMSFSVGDDPVIVRHNRGLFCAALDLDPSLLVVPGQVHGTRLALAGPGDRGRGAGSRRTVVPDTDGLVTGSAAVPLVVSFADCLAIALAGHNAGGERVIALVHAGWRGLLDGIVGAAARLLAAAGEVETAVIGPSICPQCFAVGDDVARRFRARFGRRVVPRLGGEPHVDLWACATAELTAAGLAADAIVNPRLCTFSDRRFYSHRRESERAGRQIAVAWIHETQP